MTEMDGVRPATGPGGARPNILVVQTSFIGDAVLVQPLIAALRERFPQCTLTLLCTPVVADLVGANPDLNHVLSYDKRGEAKGLRGLRRLARVLQDKSYTVAIAAHKSFRTALLLRLAGIPLRIGFRQSAGWFLYHRRVRRRPDEHEVVRNLSLLRGLDVDPEGVARALTLSVSETHLTSVREKLKSAGITEEVGRIRFGINPGSVWRTKRWSVGGYASLITVLKDKYTCDVLIFGGPDDVSTGRAIQEGCGRAAIDFTARFTLAELPAALDGCDVLISNDSAPMHMAVARGVPVVALFCATTPALGFYPFSAKSIVVQKDLHCRPCGSHGGHRCPLGTYACIEGLRVDTIIEAVERVLERSADATPYSYTPEFVTV